MAVVDRAAQLIGDRYSHDELIDDTGLAGAMSDHERWLGNPKAAALLRRDVLSSRLNALADRECRQWNRPRKQCA